MVSLQAMSVASAILGFLVVLAWRIREGRTAVTIRKIVISPLGMTTGFSMFFVSAFGSWGWAAGVFVLGALIQPIRWCAPRALALHGETVMMHRSASLFVVVIGLGLSSPKTSGLISGPMTLAGRMHVWG
jgi:membrane protein CcdC involved in cytochrome C biogenesis